MHPAHSPLLFSYGNSQSRSGGTSPCARSRLVSRKNSPSGAVAAAGGQPSGSNTSAFCANRVALHPSGAAGPSHGAPAADTGAYRHRCRIKTSRQWARCVAADNQQSSGPTRDLPHVDRLRHACRPGERVRDAGAAIDPAMYGPGPYMSASRFMSWRYVLTNSSTVPSRS